MMIQRRRGGLLILAVLGMSCARPPQSMSQGSPSGESTSGESTSGESVAHAERYLSCWNQYNARDWERFVACYGVASTVQGVGFPIRRGRQEILGAAQAETRAFSAGRGDAELVLASGNDVVSIVRFTGTHDGPMAGTEGDIPASGRKVGYLMFHRARFDGEVAVEEQWIADLPTLLSQTGLSPVRARAPLEASSSVRPRVITSRRDPTEKANSRLAEEFQARARSGSADLGDLFTDELVLHFGPDAEDVRGKASVLERYARWAKEREGAEVTLVMAGGAYTFSLSQARAGRPAGASKSASQPALSTVAEFLEWQEGRVNRIWRFANAAELLAEPTQ